MNGSNIIFIANVVVWTGVVAYVLGLVRRHKRLEQRLRQLEVSCDAQHTPE